MNLRLFVALAIESFDHCCETGKRLSLGLFTRFQMMATLLWFINSCSGVSCVLDDRKFEFGVLLFLGPARSW